MPEPSNVSPLADRAYYAVDPNGNKVPLNSRELFEAIKYFMLGEKPNGSMTVHFKSGGVAGVKIERTYK